MESRRPSAPVLLVEDNPETRGVLRLLLETEGYAVATAGDGQEALDYLRSGQPVSLIVLDLRMPVMDGWTFLGLLRHDPVLRDIPVIAFSAVLDRDVPNVVASIRKGTVDPNVLLRIIGQAARDPEAT